MVSVSYLTKITKDGSTALMYATHRGDIDIVRLLLERGADPNKQTKDGWTPLMYATEKGNIDIVRLLLENGADPTKRTKDGWTAKELARLDRKHMEIFSLLHYTEHYDTDTTTDTTTAPPTDTSCAIQ